MNLGFFSSILLALLACAPELRAQEPSATGRIALRVGKILTMRGAPIDDGVILIENGKIRDLGAKLAIPEGFTVIDAGKAWASPGLIDLHSHAFVRIRGFNESSHSLNPELRTIDTIAPWDASMRRALHMGVTTVLSISGSGVNVSSFGTLHKLRPAGTLKETIVQHPGALKVAQDWNPERFQDLGFSRMGMQFMMRHVNARAIEYARARATGEYEPDPSLEFMADLHERKIPVLVHTAGHRGVHNTLMMWNDEYGTRMVVSHGSFHGWKAGPLAAERDAAVNNGPRMFDATFTRDGVIHGLASENYQAGVRRLSLNTDAPVIPQEDLIFQGTLAARLGLPDLPALMALTYQGAEALGVEDRIGSLAPGMDADVLVTAGSPIDVRAGVRMVFVDGHLVYDAQRKDNP